MEFLTETEDLEMEFLASLPVSTDFLAPAYLLARDFHLLDHGGMPCLRKVEALVQRLRKKGYAVWSAPDPNHGRVVYITHAGWKYAQYSAQAYWDKTYGDRKI